MSTPRDNYAITLAREHERMPSPRQLEALRWYAALGSVKAVAAQMGVGESTVKWHLVLARRLLGVPTTTQAIVAAVRRGWLVIAREDV